MGIGSTNVLLNILDLENISGTAMAAILRDKINDLLTANADLEREVVKLRYADAARGAAESVETLNKLRKTRDTLNDIVNENDQLKIEEDFSSSWTSKRNEELKQKQEDMKVSKRSDNSKHDDDEHDDEIKNESADNLSKYLTELLRIKKQLLNRDGTINWSHANQFM